MKIRMLALGLLLAASPAFAADVDGTKISFAVDVDFGGQVTTIPYTGVVAPAELKLTMEFMGMPMEITAKKAK